MAEWKPTEDFVDGQCVAAGHSAAGAVGRVCDRLPPEYHHIVLMYAAATLHQQAAHSLVASVRGAPDGIFPPTDPDITALVKGWARIVETHYPDFEAIRRAMTTLREEVLGNGDA